MGHSIDRPTNTMAQVSILWPISSAVIFWDLLLISTNLLPPISQFSANYCKFATTTNFRKYFPSFELFLKSKFTSGQWQSERFVSLCSELHSQPNHRIKWSHSCKKILWFLFNLLTIIIFKLTLAHCGSITQFTYMVYRFSSHHFYVWHKVLLQLQTITIVDNFWKANLINM